MATTPATTWHMRGRGYEFCNCDFGCGCNFGGFPNSKDGSCRALVGVHILSGTCGDVDLSGIKCAAIVAWPKAIHEGNGKAVFVVEPATTDAQINALAQIFTGKLGGLPWREAYVYFKHDEGVGSGPPAVGTFQRAFAGRGSASSS